jgi:hypothetical protein
MLYIYNPDPSSTRHFFHRLNHPLNASFMTDVNVMGDEMSVAFAISIAEYLFRCSV